MNYVFGPVTSRRLGASLGVDPIPLKTCNWNCVYCQLGRTRPLTNTRKEYVPAEDILNEMDRALSARDPSRIDWITFVGSGEPTLHKRLGWMIREVQGRSDIPVAVITNGALFYLPEVRDQVAAADAVLPTLDAGSEERYRIINRPHPETTYQRLVEGLIAFREQYRGKFWLELMLVGGLNDGERVLLDLKQVIERIRPDKVHLTLPNRPPAETWVKPPDEEGLMRARAILGEVAEVAHPAEGSFKTKSEGDLLEIVMGIITRHPMRSVELERTLAAWQPRQVRKALQALKSAGRAQAVVRHNTRFWSAVSSYYPDESRSEASRPSARGRRRIRSHQEE
jgi:wyosine [tRNA(Phe)-imidazoG37] synthetase (radical SAM superfamily)